jgi:hypothetical protein
MSGGITIHEMESAARGMGPDIMLGGDLGNVIELGGGDGLGLDMLSNIGIARSSQASESRQFSFDPSNRNTGMPGGNGPSGGGSGSGMSEIEIGRLEPIEPITLNLGGGPGGSSAPVEIQFSKSTNDIPTSSGLGTTPGGLFSNSQTASGPFTSLAPASAPRLSPEEEKKEKADLINKLERLEKKGLQVTRRYTMDNTLEEIKTEYARLVDSKNLEASIRFQRQALMSVVTGMEWMNGKFDPFDIKLDGWSESVHENVEDFDEIFEELYDKYKERGKMPPEARLVMALAGSGFMCHVSNTFLRAKMPSADDILKNNPDLARQFAAAAATQAGPGFGNFMSMAMGGVQGAPQQGSQQQQRQPGAFFGSSAAPPMAQMPQPVAAMEPSRSTARREMAGPSGMDDILKTFDEVRRNEAMDGRAMSSILEVDPNTQPALAAAIEIQSMVSGDDIGSAAESARTGRSGRRKRTAPVGNTFSINV